MIVFIIPDQQKKKRIFCKTGELYWRVASWETPASPQVLQFQGEAGNVGIINIYRNRYRLEQYLFHRGFPSSDATGLAIH